MNESLLDFSDVSLWLPGVTNRAILAGVDLSVRSGEIVGLVGESGSGKSVSARAALGLEPPRAVVNGSITVAGIDVRGAGPRELRRLRTEEVAMIFQDPRSGINPLRRIGDFLTESARLARGEQAGTVRLRALEMMAAVGLPDPERHLSQYPHELSGGMLQRVMIASALMGDPKLLLCDEPTTALDVTTQAEIVTLLMNLQRSKAVGMLFITHDLDLASAICDRIYVMYAGRVVESASATDLFTNPKHPYTAGLLASRPSLDRGEVRLASIRGVPLSLADNPPGCAFSARCPYCVEELCRTELPTLKESDIHSTSCLREDDLHLAASMAVRP